MELGTHIPDLVFSKGGLPCQVWGPLGRGPHCQPSSDPAPLCPQGTISVAIAAVEHRAFTGGQELAGPCAYREKSCQAGESGR